MKRSADPTRNPSRLTSLLRRSLLTVLLLPFLLIDRFYHLLLFAISAQRTTDGFTLYSVDDDPVFFDRANQALAVLKRTDQRRYRRALRYTRVIAHVKQGGNFYNPHARAFYVHEYPDDIAYFASLMVHEATHGYLLHQRVRRDKDRHERLCISEQLRFIAKCIRTQSHLTSTQQQAMIEEWRSWFDQELASDWWDEKQVLKRQMAAFKATIRQLWHRERKSRPSSDGDH